MLIYISFLLGTSFSTLASIPTNGVVQTGRYLGTLLNAGDSESAYSQCMNQGRGARYFSNSCTKLIDTLRKKMNMMVLESDLQMQAERLAPKPLTKEASSRINLLAKINLLSTQAEETIKTAQTASRSSDSKDDMPDIVTAIQKVQQTITSYSALLPNGTP